ncbi:hypothetical protein [Azospirillum sp. TSO22-1]|uniref:hypothetical protein n=1 Tax=Azospirillum sp. TSO22-1 TaxID=716789 RepID=UPI000D61143D|nr:hypothetical protein [Azospirillum sp. TSO22-1]PWC54612.1 hypothetical protein TSO221_08215 [Azospirillum sp. TSO22-1]
MTFAAAIAQSAQSAVQAQKTPRGPAEVEAAVRNASAKTGVNFAYLMEKAATESGFRTDVKSSSSSATGLYQFIDSTWLTTLKEHGGDHGLGQYANAIQTRSDGRPYVSDPEMRNKILELRKDPNVSALMAAEFTKDNQDYLKENVDKGQIGSTELYMAHFLGAAGAAKFLNAMHDSPNRQAQDLFPEAAAANKAVFIDKETGRGKTLKEIYDRFAKRFDEIGGAPAAAATERVRRQDMPDGFTTQMPSVSAHTIGGTPLSMYQILALNALETPDEAETNTMRPGNRKSVSQPERHRMRDEPVRGDQTAETGLGLGLGRTPFGQAA